MHDHKGINETKEKFIEKLLKYAKANHLPIVVATTGLSDEQKNEIIKKDIKIDIEENKTKGVDLISVRDAVRVAFSSRRKMLVNNLMNTYKFSREKAEEVLTKAGLSLTVRGENLTANDFVNLSEVIYKG